jgi:hypothetical protein
VNVFLPDRFVEVVQRLALGVEPIDAVTRFRLARPVAVALDGPPNLPPRPAGHWPEPDAALGLPALSRHSSGRYALVFADEIDSPVVIRLVPRGRRYVPRRMVLAIPTLAAVLAAEENGADVPTSARVWRPRLFPGAAYDLAEARTVVRGRVLDGDEPVRWTRVRARVGDEVIGVAHGDDRGEFLLVLGQNTGAVGDLVSPLEVTLEVFARDPLLEFDPADPLADLEPEDPAEAAAADDEELLDVADPPPSPAHYALVASLVDQPLTLGRPTSVSIAV